MGPETCHSDFGGGSRPVILFAALIAVSAIAYMPLAHRFTSLAWWSFGPFTFQTSRIVHYMVYFLIGVAVGAWGLNRGLLSPPLAVVGRSFSGFLHRCECTHYCRINIRKSLASPDDRHGRRIIFACAASCFAFLALFVRFAEGRSRVFDGLAANSYGIYLVHYAIVS